MSKAGKARAPRPPSRARHTNDSSPMVRQWAILRLLADGSTDRAFSVKELADQLGASKATITRDLQALSKDFALIEEVKGAQKKVYRIDQQIRALETIKFSLLELFSIHASMSALRGLHGTLLHEQLLSVSQKLRGFLSPHHNGGLDAMAGVFLPHTRGHVALAEHAALLDDLTDAIARRKICRGTYYSPWKKTTKQHSFRPLKLVWHLSTIYLFAQVVGKREISTFAVQRFRELEPTKETFPPPRLNLEKHVRKAFGIFVSDRDEDVEIEFEPDVVWRLEERVFHPDERKEPLPDGRMRYRLRTGAQWEIVPWVLSFGANATLVKPVAWRQSIAETLSALAPRYCEAEAPRP